MYKHILNIACTVRCAGVYTQLTLKNKSACMIRNSFLKHSKCWEWGRKNNNCELGVDFSVRKRQKAVSWGLISLSEKDKNPVSWELISMSEKVVDLQMFVWLLKGKRFSVCESAWRWRLRANTFLCLRRCWESWSGYLKHVNCKAEFVRSVAADAATRSSINNVMQNSNNGICLTGHLVVQSTEQHTNRIHMYIKMKTIVNLTHNWQVMYTSM